MKEVSGVYRELWSVNYTPPLCAGVLLREPIAMVAGPVTPHYKTLQKQREKRGI